MIRTEILRGSELVASGCGCVCELCARLTNDCEHFEFIDGPACKACREETAWVLEQQAELERSCDSGAPIPSQLDWFPEDALVLP